MTPHADRTSLAARLNDRIRELTTNFVGSVFRFVRPTDSSVKNMFAGKGALHAHGRWLIQGSKLAVYTSLMPETALAEALAANRYYGFPDSKSAPLVFVTAKVKLKQIIDLRDGWVRQRLRLGMETIIATDWRAENRSGGEAITQAWGWAMHEAGIEGFIGPSAAIREGENLIIFPENLGRSSLLKVTKEVDWPR